MSTYFFRVCSRYPAGVVDQERVRYVSLSPRQSTVSIVVLGRYGQRGVLGGKIGNVSDVKTTTTTTKHKQAQPSATQAIPVGTKPARTKVRKYHVVYVFVVRYNLVRLLVRKRGTHGSGRTVCESRGPFHPDGFTLHTASKKTRRADYVYHRGLRLESVTS